MTTTNNQTENANFIKNVTLTQLHFPQLETIKDFRPLEQSELEKLPVYKNLIKKENADDNLKESND